MGIQHLTPVSGEDVIVLSFFATFFTFKSLPFSLRLHDLILIPIPQSPFIHSFSFISPFHTSQEQDEMAHGLLLTIHYWYMRIGIVIVEEPFVDLVDRHRLSSHELGSLVISALPRRA